MKETLIKNALVYDGTGAKPFYSDVLISGTKIARIGRIPAEDHYEVVDANGLALSPGFINTHSHMELEIIRDPRLHQVIDQGITTEVLGQDGSSVAPLTDDLVQELADNMAPLAGTIPGPYTWRSFSDYMNVVEEMKPAARFVSLVGHGTLRMNVMGNDNREPTPEELQAMKDLLIKCMEEGAKGMSLGLIYPPGSFAKTDELIELAKVVAAYDGLIMVHMRSEKDKLLEAVDEMRAVVENSGVRLQISHHKALGPRNWGKVHQSVASIYAMRDKGYDVTIDQYPWTAACTGLKVCVPQWAYDGGEQGFQNRLKDPAVYQQILKETRDEIEVRGGAQCIMLASVATEEYAWMAGLKMDEAGNGCGQRRSPYPAARRPGGHCYLLLHFGRGCHLCHEERHPLRLHRRHRGRPSSSPCLRLFPPFSGPLCPRRKGHAAGRGDPPHHLRTGTPASPLGPRPDPGGTGCGSGAL